MKLNVILVVGLLIVSFLGCEGPEGSTGPMGPEGSAGPEGPQGDIGPSGNSDLSVLEFNYTLSEGEIDGRVVFYELITTLIDQDVINNGTVVAQMASGGGEYAALPLTDCYDDNDDGAVDQCYELTYTYELNKLTIIFSNTIESINWNPDYRLYIKASIFGS